LEKNSRFLEYDRHACNTTQKFLALLEKDTSGTPAVHLWTQVETAVPENYNIPGSPPRQLDPDPEPCSPPRKKSRTRKGKGKEGETSKKAAVKVKKELEMEEGTFEPSLDIESNISIKVCSTYNIVLKSLYENSTSPLYRLTYQSSQVCHSQAKSSYHDILNGMVRINNVKLLSILTYRDKIDNISLVGIKVSKSFGFVDFCIEYCSTKCIFKYVNFKKE
jgi:hypothetical protein